MCMASMVHGVTRQLNKHLHGMLLVDVVEASHHPRAYGLSEVLQKLQIVCSNIVRNSQTKLAGGAVSE